ncbi:MAG: ATP-dependent DNA helicase RecG, partial [Oscillospiraceae bacterium]|nr:ATP-dependent DNA helicase RecG [Oscillospiraceae bacterium]
ITDEQHRFGVKQRAALTQKGQNPHLLVMSATPIPRTLGLIIFGELDISIIDEMPPGRTPVKTVLIGADKHARAYNFIKENINKGQQCFVVCPLVNEGAIEAQAAESYAAELMLQEFADIPVGVLHGKMKPKQKAEVMEQFAKNELSILVATTVIEVGIDVPNATIMLIENAERFGLSQLHQLRGRVGRGSKKSWCILVSDSQNENTLQRLAAMCKTNDGFKIADEDLKQRGPGDFFGNKQHGLPQLKIAEFSDSATVELSSQAANEIIEHSPDLSAPELKYLLGSIKRLFPKGNLTL